MEKTNKELRFKYYATADARLQDQDKSENDIAFVAEEGKIYTHNTGFGGGDLSDVYTKPEIDEKLKDVQDAVDEINNIADEARESIQDDINDVQQDVEDIKSRTTATESNIDSIQKEIKDTSDEINSLIDGNQSIQDDLNNLRQSVESAVSKSDATKSELDSFKQNLQDEIESGVEDAIKEYQTDENGKTVWTRLTEADDGIQAVTTKLNVAHDANGNIKYTDALQTVINTGISNNKSYSDLSNRYAVLEDNQKVIKWLADGFKSQADDKSSFAQIWSAGSTDNADAIAKVKTEILETADGKYVAKGELTSKVQDIIEDEIDLTSLSDVVTSADLQSATASIDTRFKGIDDSITLLNSTSSANTSKIEAITSIDGKGATILNQSTLDDAMVKLLTNTNSGSYSKVTLISEGQASGIDISSAIEDAVGKATSDFVTKNYVDEADGSIIDSITAVRNAIKDKDGNLISSSAIETKADSVESKLNLLADWNGNTPTSYKSGLMTSAAMDKAVSKLFAENETSDSKINVNKLWSGLETTVNKIKGEYVAENTLTSKVLEVVKQGAGVNSLSEISTHSDLDGAVTTINSKFTNVDTAIASLTATSTSNSSKLESITSIGDNNATVLSESALDTALVKLLTNDKSGAYARVSVISEGQASGVDINSAINTAVTNATADFVTKNYVDNQNQNVTTSITDITNAIKDKDNKLISSSGILAKATDNESKLDAIATWNSNNTPNTWNSSLITSAKLGSAVADLFASTATNTAKSNVNSLISSGTAGISSRVSQIENNYVASSKISAALKDTNGTITAASIIAAVNGDSSDVTINANKINLNGVTWANIINFNDQINSYLSSNNASITNNNITLGQSDDSDERYQVVLTPAAFKMFALTPTNAKTSGYVEINTAGMKFLSEDGRSQEGFEYSRDGVHNSDTNTLVIKYYAPNINDPSSVGSIEVAADYGTFTTLYTDALWSKTTNGAITVDATLAVYDGNSYSNIDANKWAQILGVASLYKTTNGSIETEDDIVFTSVDDPSGIKYIDASFNGVSIVKNDSTRNAASWKDIVDVANIIASGDLGDGTYGLRNQDYSLTLEPDNISLVGAGDTLEIDSRELHYRGSGSAATSASWSDIIDAADFSIKHDSSNRIPISSSGYQFYMPTLPRGMNDVRTTINYEGVKVSQESSTDTFTTTHSQHGIKIENGEAGAELLATELDFNDDQNETSSSLGSDQISFTDNDSGETVTINSHGVNYGGVMKTWALIFAAIP